MLNENVQESESKDEWAMQLEAIMSQLCISIEDIKKLTDHKLTDRLEYNINDSYTIDIALKTSIAFQVIGYFNSNIQAIMKEIQDINVDKNKINYVNALLLAVPKVVHILFTDQMQCLVLDVLKDKSNKVFQSKDGRFTKLESNEITIDLFNEELSIYTKISFSILFIVLKSFFLKTKQTI
jgi:hypothetical protein